MHEVNRWKGLVIGGLGGAVGTLAMGYYFQALGRLPGMNAENVLTQGNPLPDSLDDVSLVGQQYEEGEGSTAAVGRIAYTAVAGDPPQSEETKTALSEIVHWNFGITMGALHGLLRPRARFPDWQGGAIFGATVWLFGSEMMVPLLGLSGGPSTQPLFTHTEELSAHLVIIGSYVPEGITIGAWVTAQRRGITAFYDIDTPVTLARLRRNDCEYLSPELIPQYDLYLSFAGGPLLQRLQKEYGAALARPLYCSVDPERYVPEPQTPLTYDLGYMGTYSIDRQPQLERFLCEPARRWPIGHFIVAGPQYPNQLDWPPNVSRVEHLAPDRHRRFYTSQRFTLNITRSDMIASGYAPGVRLFEAAACGTPIISDYWPGLETFFVLYDEILPIDSIAAVLQILQQMPEEERRAIAERARRRVLREHSAMQRAAALEGYVDEAITQRIIAPSIMRSLPNDS